MQDLRKKLAGIYPALITPFTDENKVHEDSLRAIVRLNMEKGVQGFYVGGSSGEAFLLSLDERMRLLEIVTDEAGGKARVIAHVGCISTDDSITLARHAKLRKVDAISAVSPFYYKFSIADIQRHYFRLADAVEMPLIVYNIPKLSGVELSAGDVGKMRSNPYVSGIKHTSMNLFQMERMRSADPGLVIFNGFDEMCLGGLSMGADGAIGTTYNFMAEIFLELRRRFLENRIAEAFALQARANAVISGMMETGGVFPGSKYILKKKYGIDCGVCRHPFRTLAPEEEKHLDRLMEEHLSAPVR